MVGATSLSPGPGERGSAPTRALGTERRLTSPSPGPAQSPAPAHKATGRCRRRRRARCRAEPLARASSARPSAGRSARGTLAPGPSAGPPVVSHPEPPGGAGFGAAAMSMGLEIAGTSLAVLGWLGTIVCCALPMWRVTAFIGSNIITAQIIWEGLWMNCVVQSTGQMQCKVYDSLLALPQDLQAARALIVVAILLAAFGLLVALVGAQCTNCVQDDAAKAKITIVAGVLYLLAALLTLVPVSWSANTIIGDFYNPLVVDSQKRELGAGLYVGWAAAALQLLGGALLCCSCPPREKKYVPPKILYSAPRSVGQVTGTTTAYDRKDYV
ncbi:claudin-3 [Dasypus novemcinctus]|uniref:claudin-3 n=1 Tax=Dasypus novemcinctus TaxID=9361 RepID=UPI0039C9581B